MAAAARVLGRAPLAVGIRPMAPGDVDAVRWLEGTALEQERPREAWLRELAGAAHGALVAEVAGRVVGFVAFTRVADEVDIAHMAVAPELRRRGIGRRLLTRVLDEARAAGAGTVVLDVRCRNRAARRLYEGFGFVPVGDRPGYYRAPPDDALVCRLDLPVP